MASKDHVGYRLSPAASRKVAEVIGREMKAQQLTQVALAKKTGIPQGLISLLLSGGRPFWRLHVVNIGKALGRTERELLPPGVFPSPSGDEVLEQVDDESRQTFIELHRNELSPLEVNWLNGTTINYQLVPKPTEALWWGLVNAWRDHQEALRRQNS